MPKRKYVSVATDALDWLRAIDADGNTRYYVNSTTGKAFAKEFDAKADPVLVRGHGLINTKVSGLYAENLYPSLAEAQTAANPPPVADTPDDADGADDVPSCPLPTTPGPDAPPAAPYRRNR